MSQLNDPANKCVTWTLDGPSRGLWRHGSNGKIHLSFTATCMDTNRNCERMTLALYRMRVLGKE